MIYAIRAVGTEFIKFGKAKSVGQRLHDLQCASPHALIIEAVADWPDNMERTIHSALSAFHVRGEWYRDCEDASQIIEAMRENMQSVAKDKAIKQNGGESTPLGLSVARTREPFDLAAWRAKRAGRSVAAPLYDRVTSQNAAQQGPVMGRSSCGQVR